MHDILRQIIVYQKGEQMNQSRTKNSVSLEYLVCFRVYVQASGGVLVVMGNQRLVLSADEIRALLDGVLDYAQVFAALNRELTTTTLEVLEKNSIVKGS
jgi:hypothetical protein